MKLLEKKQINATVQAERKSVIDSGISLAKKVDTLRTEMLSLEKQRSDFIANSKSVITASIEGLKTEEGILKSSVQQETKKLAKLREPLDAEWKILGEEKTAVAKLKQQGEEYVGVLIEERRGLATKNAEMNTLHTSAVSYEKRTARLLDSAHSDREEAKTQLKQAKKLKETKEVQLYEKENQLNIREKGLDTREKALRIEQLALSKEKKLLAMKKQRIK